MDCLAIANRALCSSSVSVQTQQQQATHLECTGTDMFKISSDVAVDQNKGIGIGAVLVDGDGLVVACRYGFKQGMFTVVEGEALAMVEGLKLCHERGSINIIAETDCQQLYWLLQRQETDLSYLGDTLREISEMKRNFQSLAFSWTPREGNAIADRLASVALSSFSPLSSSLGLPFDVNYVPSF
ncbi:uncharacterized protein LOC131003926 [Salvia miltiorrhiza]|uniref:uncharacterized protein LOC131003926 n=1 Tax=Salvia miltiorrhiza TaxID=226208 RepID=UPI0025AC3FA4|nr:uncharacterized protein LOC131003926 [Salvia miltiorrhiza]